MLGIKKILRELKTRYLQAFESKRISVRLKQPIISITFDDVPRTALTNGVPILEKFNVKATFYIAMGLSRQDVESDAESSIVTESFIRPDEVRALSRSGHDIACHTYSHYMLNTGSADKMRVDAQKNVHELCELLNSSVLDHFSYPFGQVNFKAKSLLGEGYKSMRSSRSGVNWGVIDMNLLRAESVYSVSFDEDAIRQSIKKAALHGGWLIFYTHGVTDSPDDYSCTPGEFEWLLEQCKSSGAEVLPVSEAYAIIHGFSRKT